ncbi:hypothetical protein M3Y99_01821000 [Aphelenchoides fujianensis]|nr:hypothetical protein M3Y99_01821000 [Aphelenchoides fujianensis]
MIGIMNQGSDQGVEFYSAAKRSSLYNNTRRRETISYLEDGRTLLDGHVVEEQSPDQMWSSLLLRVACHSLCRDSLQRGRPSKKERIRRFFNQLSVHNDDVRPEEKDDKRLAAADQQPAAPYVTTIVIQQGDDEVKQPARESRGG